MAPLANDFVRLRTIAESERDRAIDSANTAFRKAIEAIELVERLAGQDPSAAPTVSSLPVKTIPSPSPARTGNPVVVGLRESVRRFLAQHDGQFSLPDVAAYLATIGGPSNRSHISAELYRIQKKGVIEIVSRGGGTTPHVFRQKQGDELTLNHAMGEAV